MPPTWLINILIHLAITIGLPALSKLLIAKLPFLSPETITAILKAVEDALLHIENGGDKKEAVVKAKSQVRALRYGHGSHSKTDRI